MRSLLASAGLLFTAVVAWSAAPPPLPRNLTAQQEKEVDALDARLERHAAAGQFVQAARLAEQIVAYRERRQGARHWQVIDARLDVEDWRCLSTVPALDRAEVVRARALASEGTRLYRRARFPEAESKLREALAIRRKVLGEQHPSTATSWNLLALSLAGQGKHTEALPLYRKALAIRQQVLGQQHAHVAQSYHNVGNCLNDLGKHSEALVLLRIGLAVGQRVLGEDHPDVANHCDALAACLDDRGKHAEALALFHQALQTRRKLLGEEDLDTGRSHNNVASLLAGQGKHAEALRHYQKALAIYRKKLGEQHPNTALCTAGVADCLRNQGRYAEALSLYQQALATHVGRLGEHHPRVVHGYQNVVYCLNRLGKHAEALPLARKALTISVKMRGEDHPTLAESYRSLARCLELQGRAADALPLYEKALAIRVKALGERHSATAGSYNNLAICLGYLGKHAQALPLFRKAQAIDRQTMGEDHANTDISSNNLALCLIALGQYAEAHELCQRILTRRLRVLGEQHPRTATSFNTVAGCLDHQGKHAQAQPLFQKARDIRRALLGEQHPLTAQSAAGVAKCLSLRGRHADAVALWEQALLGHEVGRLQASTTGFDRALFQGGGLSPRAALAACLLRLGEPVRAWEQAESDLARGLLDDLDGPAKATDAAGLSRVQGIERRLLPLLTRASLSVQEKTQRDSLITERDAVLSALARRAAQRATQRVLPLRRIQKQIPTGAALFFWLDVLGEHHGCVLRGEGPPVWVKLPGSGKDGAWSRIDNDLPARALAALADPAAATDCQPLLTQLQRQRIAPLEPHLRGVTHLLVVPQGAMTAVPVEALTERFVVSYVPSASVFARRMEEHRPVRPTSLLVLADPVFTRAAPVLPPAPPHGLLVLSLTPGSVASRIGLRPGDILLEQDGQKLSKVDDLRPAAAGVRVRLKVWREGKAFSGPVPGGRLGVAVDRRPVALALEAWRKQESRLLALARGASWQPLPGTRLEARLLARLMPATLLLGSEASQQKLEELSDAGKLKQFRLLHLATHGQASKTDPRQTALILAQDRLPATAQDAVKGRGSHRKPLDGRLTVGTILDRWHLDADLVVLSACQSGLGKETGGEGMLGFTQALLQKGARSVVLSRWKVDDNATAILMVRFYENLLGKRGGAKQSLPRAKALSEAKKWLRTLPRQDAERLVTRLAGGQLRGSVDQALPSVKGKPANLPEGERPFAHPYYWAAFVLIGDPS
jgi:tetratricopeptide (TPR) repeat protein